MFSIVFTVVSIVKVNATYLDEDCMQKFTCNVGPQPDVELLGGCDDSKHMVCMASDGVYDCVCDEDYQMDMDGNCVAGTEMLNESVLAKA